MSEKECILDIPVEHLENIFGQFDANIKLIEQTLSVTFIARDDRTFKKGRDDHQAGSQLSAGTDRTETADQGGGRSGRRLYLSYDLR